MLTGKSNYIKVILLAWSCASSAKALIFQPPNYDSNRRLMSENLNFRKKMLSMSVIDPKFTEQDRILNEPVSYTKDNIKSVFDDLDEGFQDVMSAFKDWSKKDLPQHIEKISTKTKASIPDKSTIATTMKKTIDQPVQIVLKLNEKVDDIIIKEPDFMKAVDTNQFGSKARNAVWKVDDEVQNLLHSKLSKVDDELRKLHSKLSRSRTLSNPQRLMFQKMPKVSGLSTPQVANIANLFATAMKKAAPPRTLPVDIEAQLQQTEEERKLKERQAAELREQSRLVLIEKLVLNMCATNGLGILSNIPVAKRKEFVACIEALSESYKSRVPKAESDRRFKGTWSLILSTDNALPRLWLHTLESFKYVIHPTLKQIDFISTFRSRLPFLKLEFFFEASYIWSSLHSWRSHIGFGPNRGIDESFEVCYLSEDICILKNEANGHFRILSSK